MKLIISEYFIPPPLILVAVTCLFCGNAFSSIFSIDGIFFEQKMPLPGGDLNSSLVVPSESLQILKNDADVINFLGPAYTIRIVGRTDGHECEAQQCLDLSLRRAQLVYDWMVEHGIPRSRMFSPEGRGSTLLLSDDTTPRGQARNRYVEFELVPDTPPR